MIKMNPSKLLISDIATKLKLTKSQPGAIITAAIKHGLSNNLLPKNIQASYIETDKFQAYRVNPINRAKLNDLLESQKKFDSSYTLTSITMGLLCAVANEDKNKVEVAAPNPPAKWLKWLKVCGLTERPEQAQLIRETLQQLEAAKDSIVMVEGSVGIGKSYALIATAVSSALTSEDEGVVVVAAPTYQTAKQLLESAKTLISKNNMNLTATLVRSKAEFISASLMSHFLTNGEHELGAKVIASASLLLKSGNHHKDAYEDIDIDCSRLSLSLSHDPDDEAMDSYFETRQNASQSDIVICTHAMLAAHVSSLRSRIIKAGKITFGDFPNYTKLNEQLAILSQSLDVYGKGSLLPRISLLLIDEAHALEDTYRSIQSRNISIGSLRKVIKECVKEKSLGPKLADKAIAAIDDFHAIVSQINNTTYPKKHTEKLFKTISPLLKLKTKQATSKYALFLVEEMDILSDLANSVDRSHIAYFSPVYRALSIKNQTKKPESLLDMTWRGVNKCVLVSGTLSVGGADSNYEMMAVKCCIPFERVKSIAPIETNWLREEVTLHLLPQSLDLPSAVKQLSGSAFIPPSANTPNEFKKWCKGQAAYIHTETNKLSGGSIVFCTSYEQIDLIHNELHNKCKDDNNVFIMKSIRGVGMKSVIKQYEQAYHDGFKPLWIAILSVGTGVDITSSKQQAEDDNMLQSVFITRIPNTAIDSAVNAPRSAFLNMRRESLVLSKQMIGRLVRRPGRKNMHVHLMDGRFNIKKGQYRMYSKIISHYEQATIHF
jgi:CRISPR type IV-associated DEAD/DEAH-box helicase Csf4